MEKELKPCPFCGSKNLQFIAVYGEEYYIECPICTACGPSCETVEETVKAWNRRAEDAID